MKYDKMIALNKAESEQKIKKAIRAIDDMGARGLPISVTELVRWTGLSRGFFYKNVQVRQKLEEAIKQPRRIDVQQSSEERILEKIFSTSSSLGNTNAIRSSPLYVVFLL